MSNMVKRSKHVLNLLVSTSSFYYYYYFKRFAMTTFVVFEPTTKRAKWMMFNNFPCIHTIKLTFSPLTDVSFELMCVVVCKRSILTRWQPNDR